VRTERPGPGTGASGATEPAPGLGAADDPAFVAPATVEVADVSVWFGVKVALSEVSCSFGPGVTGLLGPNGAGKTTLIRAVTGLIGVDVGAVRVLGGDPRRHRRVQRHIALVPEDEAVPAALSPRQLTRYRARLHRVADRAAPDRCLAAVGLLDVADRPLWGFSKGTRQRAKVAAALVSDPAVLVLDEPLNGTDPLQRTHLISLFRQLGAGGRTVIVSSHVLHEVERLAERVVVVVRGRLAAAGGRRAIRDAMADRPRRVLVRADAVRPLAATLVRVEAVRGVTVEGDRLTVLTDRARDLAVALPRLARDVGARLHEVQPLDESLESIFHELVR
jgi:ABC-2 type transport system ATP-binding protein